MLIQLEPVQRSPAQTFQQKCEYGLLCFCFDTVAGHVLGLHFKAFAIATLSPIKMACLPRTDGRTHTLTETVPSGFVPGSYLCD